MRAADPHDTDPYLLKRHSTFQSYTTSCATYPSIRTFYRPHPQIEKLPSDPTFVPLLVFVHGLGGSLAQFKDVLSSLVDVASCFGIDLPGCGRSEFLPAGWPAYTPDALVELILVAIDRHILPSQGFILVGHSLGSSLSASVAYSNLFAQRPRKFNVLGLIGICPLAEPPSGRAATIFKALLCLPSPLFNLWRAWDKRGGPESTSVARFVGKAANLEVKRLQERFNAQSQTPVYRRMAWGLLPNRNGISELAGLDTWAKLTIPLLLVGGDGDVVIRVDQIAKIARALGRNEKSKDQNEFSNAFTDGHTVRQPVKPSLNHELNAPASINSTTPDTETTILDTIQSIEQDSADSTSQYTLRCQVLKTSILPAPASHGLLYDPATSRTLSGLIQAFLCEYIDTRLSLGWQLQYLSTEGKWDVKNLVKWQAVHPVSEPIGGIFRAMKTLREVDDAHSPEHFAEEWQDKIKAVVDISHEIPVYDPKGLDDKGIEYYKLPTISKIPPSAEETREFAKLIDQLRAKKSQDKSDAQIGVHCHYGFNRTGFFISSYLIEREGYGVQTAIDEFARQRPPGIRHPHFLDELFVRYCVGLRREEPAI